MASSEGTTPPDRRIGSDVGHGRYVIERVLGAGSFATVYEAHDERFDASVAIKVLNVTLSGDPESHERFVREARLLRAVTDPHVVAVHEISETLDGQPYLVMDVAAGGTLAARSARLESLAPRDRELVVAVLVDQLAGGLRALHQRGIIHRDIKPSNLLILRGTVDPKATDGAPLFEPGERLAIGDLGLARAIDGGTGLTTSGGTAGYMAPEQLRPGAAVDTRADLYAASALIAELLTRDPPDPETRYRDGIAVVGRSACERVRPDIAAVLVQSLDLDPDKRHPNVDAWSNDLVQALKTARRRTPRRFLARRSAVAALSALLLGAAVVTATEISKSSPSAGQLTTTSTSIASSPTTVGVPALFAKISGPSQVQTGVRSTWVVESLNATGGTWALTGPVKVGKAEWSPGNSFAGTWNKPGPIELSLTIKDENGNTFTDRFNFTVIGDDLSNPTVCPVSAEEVGALVGVTVGAIPPTGATSVCSFKNVGAPLTYQVTLQREVAADPLTTLTLKYGSDAAARATLGSDVATTEAVTGLGRGAFIVEATPLAAQVVIATEHHLVHVIVVSAASTAATSARTLAPLTLAKFPQ